MSSTRRYEKRGQYCAFVLPSSRQVYWYRLFSFFSFFSQLVLEPETCRIRSGHSTTELPTRLSGAFTKYHSISDKLADYTKEIWKNAYAPLRLATKLAVGLRSATLSVFFFYFTLFQKACFGTGLLKHLRTSKCRVNEQEHHEKMNE